MITYVQKMMLTPVIPSRQGFNRKKMMHGVLNVDI